MVSPSVIGQTSERESTAVKRFSTTDLLAIFALSSLLGIQLIKVFSDWSSHIAFVESAYSVGDGAILKIPDETIRRIVNGRIDGEVGSIPYQPSVTFVNNEMHVDIALPAGHAVEPILKGIEKDLAMEIEAVSRQPLRLDVSKLAMRQPSIPNACLAWVSHLTKGDLAQPVAPALLRFATRAKPRIQLLDMLAGIVLVGTVLALTRRKSSA